MQKLSQINKRQIRRIMTVETNSNLKPTRSNKPKTIYKKTLTKVYKYVLSNKRTEIKIAARELNLDKESVRQALYILAKHDFIKERKYKDIGVSYYYPSDSRYFIIYVFHPIKCFLIVFDSKLKLWYKFYIRYFKNMMPDDNLHHFLKKVSNEAELDFGGLPDEVPFIAFPGRLNKNTGRIESDVIPELALLDVDSYIKDLLNNNRVKKIFYDYKPDKDYFNYEFYLELVFKAFNATFVRVQKSKNKNESNVK